MIQSSKIKFSFKAFNCFPHQDLQNSIKTEGTRGGISTAERNKNGLEPFFIIHKTIIKSEPKRIDLKKINFSEPQPRTSQHHENHHQDPEPFFVTKSLQAKIKTVALSRS
jgi:hypothetical protein